MDNGRKQLKQKVMKYYKDVILERRRFGILRVETYPLADFEDGMLFCLDRDLKFKVYNRIKQGRFKGQEISERVYTSRLNNLIKEKEYRTICQNIEDNQLFFAGNMSMIRQLDMQKEEKMRIDLEEKMYEQALFGLRSIANHYTKDQVMKIIQRKIKKL